MFFEGGKNGFELPVNESGVEANLDVQFAFGLAHPIPVRIYVLYSNLFDLIHYLLSQPSILLPGVLKSYTML